MFEILIGCIGKKVKLLHLNTDKMYSRFVEFVYNFSTQCVCDG
jgi:hypothetical protein